MKYTLSNISVAKTGEKNGKTWTLNKGTFTDGTTSVEATFFGALQEGEVEGEIKENQYGKTFEPVKKGGGRTAMMERTMDKKAQQIATAQGNKEEAIKIASCNRMALDTALAEKPIPFELPEEFQKRVAYWKAWYFVNWNNIDESLVPPF